MSVVRKNQRNLSPGEWTALINALNGMHGVTAAPPAYRDFVALHVRAMTTATGMSWGVHSMGPGMDGRNFLAWHRLFLKAFEQRLQQTTPGVTIPYWDALLDRSIPTALTNPALLTSWSVTRDWNDTRLPQQADLDVANAQATFIPFQTRLENYHNFVHRAVGGTAGVATMDTAGSPGDPVFWLHHANIDRLWAKWQVLHKRQRPPNPTEVLQPPPILGAKVSETLSIAKLGYRYG